GEGRMGEIVESARAILGADFMGLALVDDDPQSLALKYYAAPGRAEMVVEPTLVDSPLIHSVYQANAGIAAAPGERQALLAGAIFCPPAAAAALVAVPLDLDARPVGALWAARRAPGPFSDTDRIWLECLADHVIIAVKHGLMTSQLQSLSISEERARIAREMHDGLAQVLGYMNVQVQTLGAYLQQGKLDRLQAKLDQMREAVQSAHADVRENILSLRTTLANQKGFIPAVQEYLDEFGIQTQIETHFDNQAGDSLDLASIAEVQLVCILQEALANVRKHAHARTVTVRLERGGPVDDGYYLLSVRDDGAGFVPARQPRSFGLQTMSERAQGVGGSLVVWSSLDQGTQVECRIPCLQRERLRSPVRLLEDERQ
ncbi:MAG: sensor histidine kinase, partial [Chloroflexota bacterium]